MAAASRAPLSCLERPAPDFPTNDQLALENDDYEIFVFCEKRTKWYAVMVTTSEENGNVLMCLPAVAGRVITGDGMVSQTSARPLETFEACDPIITCNVALIARPINDLNIWAIRDWPRRGSSVTPFHPDLLFPTAADLHTLGIAWFENTEAGGPVPFPDREFISADDGADNPTRQASRYATAAPKAVPARANAAAARAGATDTLLGMDGSGRGDGTAV
jgi:hypothetical protein